MNPFFSMMSNDNFAMKQSFRFMSSAISVSREMTENWWFALKEFSQSPQSFARRNFDYWQEVLRPPEAEWQTNYQEIRLPEQFAKIARLLDFSGLRVVAGEIIPTLILPPQAGHHSYIADYSPEQSQVKMLRENGLGEIYCLEWLPATQETKHTTIEDYIEAVHHCIGALGGKANLIGDCQGGWLAAIFTALYPEMVNTLTVAGAPVDYQAGDGQIKEAVNYNAQLFPDGGMAFYRALVAMGNGVLDGRFMVTGFNVMKPGQTSLRYLKLYRDIHDSEQLERFREMKNWYDFTQNIAGDFYLWIVQHLFRDNELVLGKLMVEGRLVDLHTITCPLFLVGGVRDHVTPPEQVFAMRQFVGTQPSQIHEYLVDAGHIGLFMGKNVLTETWSVIGQTIERYSNLNMEYYRTSR
ncbi:MAG TPA: alpha/beta fold hydrolase [Chloroflexia bacterium]|nr:alpha/beta fold hydrolase [Chloroflexia bacterium]